MGTNYYWATNECTCCNRRDEKHIGKSSMGWEFNFQGYRDAQLSGKPEDDIVSWADWKARLLSHGAIVDEYGEKCSFDEFVAMVEVHKAPGVLRKGPDGSEYRLLNHVDAILADTQYRDVWSSYRDLHDHWKDAAGYAFGIGDFS